MGTVVIVNPAAGGGRAEARARSLCARLPDPAIRVTEGPGHATELAREAREQGAEVVVAAGGDGTTWEVVNGLLAGGAGASARPALGLLAVGTGNSFVRDLGLERPERSIEALLAGRRRPVDAVRIEHAGGQLWSVNLLTLGFSADVGELTNRRFKGLGPVGYVAAVLASLYHLGPRPFPYAIHGEGPLEFDGRPVTLLSFCNSGYTGGAMHMAPGADPADGLVDVVHIGPMRRRRLLTAFPRIFQGTHLEMPEVRTARAQAVTFAPIGPVAALVDGELLHLDLRSLTVERHALEVVA